MADKEFAAAYPRDEQGYIQFPRDVERRRELFPEGVFQHPAKANLYQIEALVDYLTEPGDIILDPFAGTGSLMLATMTGRHVILIELEDMFLGLLNEAADRFQLLSAEQARDLEGMEPSEYIAVHAEASSPVGNIIVIPGDCRQRLPIPVDHAIFSPPYANVSAVGNPFTGRSTYGRAEDRFAEGIAAYSGQESSRLNLGLLNPFLFAQTMKKVYVKLAESIRPGGTMTVILRDMQGPDGRVLLSKDCIAGAGAAGFKLQEWHKWQRPGSPRTDLAKSRGTEAIRDEDIIIFRRKQ